MRNLSTEELCTINGGEAGSVIGAKVAGYIVGKGLASAFGPIGAIKYDIKYFLL